MPRVKVPVPPEESKPIEQPPVAPVEQPQPAPPAAEPPQNAHSQPNNQKLIYVAFIVVLLIMLGVIFNLAHSKNDNASSSSSKSNQESIKLSEQIGRYVQLPSGDTPILATVKDANKLKSQSPVFFKYVQNGDKILLYRKSSEAIVYRPSTKKVIVIAPFSENGSTSTDTSTQGANSQ